MQAPDRTRNFARSLRREMSLPEVLLWNQLRRGGLKGAHFRRQHPFGPYVLDFYCATARLAVEVDGARHHDQGALTHDASRDAFLGRYGISTLRLPARVVLKDMTSALDTIAARLAGVDDPLSQPLRA
jgi:very-short-patch-repair endonuclease